MTGTIRTPYLQVKVNGSAITNPAGMTTHHGYNINIAEASFDTRALVTIAPMDLVEIIAGANLATAVTRFKGRFTTRGRELYPKAYHYNCKGSLIYADLYRMPVRHGIDLTGDSDDHHGETDEGYIGVILLWAGMDGMDADIDGTGTMMGVSLDTPAWKDAWNGAYVWRYGESALNMIQRVDAISLGYRTYDAPNGYIKRSLVSAIPTGSPDWTFTEGVDIFRASASDTVIQARDRIIVNGWSDGQQEDDSASDHHKHYEANGTPVLPLPTPGAEPYMGSAAYEFTSPMLLASDTADWTAGLGLTCHQVADWLLAEMNVNRLQVKLITPRDDAVIPGQIISLVSPTRLGLASQLLWVQEVETRIAPGAGWQMTLGCVGVLT